MFNCLFWGLLCFFFKQKTAYEISACLVGSEMCIRDSTESGGQAAAQQTPAPAQNQAPANTASAQAEGFTGFEAFGGQNAFFG